MWHDFHLQVSLLPEARDAIADLGVKLRAHLPTETDNVDNQRKVAAK